MQRQIGIARLKYEAATGQQPKPVAHPLTAQQIALRDYQSQITFDSEIRAHDPRYAQIDPDPAYDAHPFRDGFAGKLSDDELEELVGSRIERARLAGNTDAVKGTPEWRALAQALCIASYEAVARRYERNDGDFNGEPSHPMLVEAVKQEESQPVASPFAGITFEDVIKEQERLASIGLSRPKSEATLEKYRNAKDDFEAFRKDKTVSTVTLAEGIHWIATDGGQSFPIWNAKATGTAARPLSWLVELTPSRATLRKKRMRLSEDFDFLRQKRMQQVWPLRPKQKSHKFHAVTTSQIRSN